MQISLYTQLEEFTREYNRTLYRKLLKEKKVGEYLNNTTKMMESELKGLMAQGYRENEAMEFIRTNYFIIEK